MTFPTPRHRTLTRIAPASIACLEASAVLDRRIVRWLASAPGGIPDVTLRRAVVQCGVTLRDAALPHVGARRLVADTVRAALATQPAAAERRDLVAWAVAVVDAVYREDRPLLADRLPM